MKRTWVILALVLAPVLGLSSCAVALTMAMGAAADADAAQAACKATAPVARIDVTGGLPDVTTTGLSSDVAVRAEQLLNAVLIMNAASGLGLSRKAQQLGVMTALGESSLRVLGYGDGAGPDSRGLFQQRDNGAWGTLADRMDPTTSARSFFTALSGVQGWETLEPTIAAHRVQRNADPFYYARFEQAAGDVVAGLAGDSTGADGLACAPATGGGVTAAGWTKPVVGVASISSGFGTRFHPIDHVWRLHAGVDLASPCGTAIFAAADGVVVAVGGSGSDKQLDLIRVDDGGGVTSGYMHMYPSGIFAHVGDHVLAGQQIGQVGSAGTSTGCHLHFEIRTDGKAIDPVPFMAAQGVMLP